MQHAERRGEIHTKCHRINVRIDILHHASSLQTVILYQTAKQCEVLKQQRIAEYVYNIADLFV
jgi:hypothetical protein